MRRRVSIVRIRERVVLDMICMQFGNLDAQSEIPLLHTVTSFSNAPLIAMIDLVT